MIKKPKSDPPGCTNDIRSIQDALDILGGKWKLLILHYLLFRKDDINTFKKIEKDIEGISAKVLTQELKTLEANDLIKRETLKTKPISVQYSITEYGSSTQAVMNVLVNWGMQHRMRMFSNANQSAE